MWRMRGKEKEGREEEGEEKECAGRATLARQSGV